MYSSSIKEIADKASIPNPVGYKLLVAVPTVEEKTAGGIIRPDILRQKEEVASIFGFVISMGPDAYTDGSKFPTGPWCKIGDWVVFRSYSGTRFKVEDQEFRLINDDTVEAVIDDPRQIQRV